MKDSTKRFAERRCRENRARMALEQLVARGYRSQADKLIDAMIDGIEEHNPKFHCTKDSRRKAKASLEAAGATAGQ